VRTLKDKIKELTEIVQEIGKLMDVITTELGRLALLIMALQTVIHIIKGG
jgi:prefoldin subunit 5